MANYCEKIKQPLSEVEIDDLTNAYDTFRKELVSGGNSIILDKVQAAYLKIGRANLENILDIDAYTGIAIAFGLRKKTVDGIHSYTLTTIVTPLVIDGMASDDPGSPGQCKMEAISSNNAFDDLGQGGAIIKSSYLDFDKKDAVKEIGEILAATPSLKSLVTFVLQNSLDFEYLKG